MCVAFFLGAFCFSLFSTDDSAVFFFSILPSIQIIFGVFIIFLAIFYFKHAYKLFIGLAFLGWGILEVFFYSNQNVLSFEEGWPLFGIISGIFIFISGFYKYKKLRFGYVIPSIAICCISFWYLLFSLNIIKMSLTSVAANFGFAFILGLFAVLMIIYFVQKRHKELIVLNDKPEVFEDELIEITDSK